MVLAVMNGFDLKMEQIHNDTTSVMVRGAYNGQNAKAVQLKRGHSKERRPDLKQLVYSLCVTADGAVPVHFKAYDGNQTDDGIHLETWNRLRTLLQHPRFIYVADCKLCTEKNLRTIDAERGFFVTIVPKTRSEVATFSDACSREVQGYHPRRADGRHDLPPHHPTGAAPACQHQSGKRCAIGGYGWNLPADNGHQGEAHRRVQDLQVPTQDREATCAAQINAGGCPDLVEEEHAHRGFDVPRVHRPDGRRARRARAAAQNGS